MKNLKVVIVASIVFVVLFIFLIASLAIIPTGYIGIKVKFGKAQDGIIEEGLNFKTPFIENVVKIDCRTKKIEIDSEASTKDLQTVTASIAVNYNVDREKATEIYREIGTGYEDIIIAPAILESIKAAMAQYTAEELITKRSEVSNAIQTALIDKISDRGFNISEFNVTNLDFSKEYDQAIEAKAVKQQEVVTAQAELEKQKIQNEKEISIAEKDARVMELQNSQITDKTLELKKLEVTQKFIEKWNGTLPTTMLSDNVNALMELNQ